MPRARMLKPGFFKNEELAALPFEARLCYAGLWTIADRDGRLIDKPKRIKAEIFPYDELDLDPVLERLREAHFIVRYRVNGDGYIAIPKFRTHQHPHPKEPESDIPSPPKKVTGRQVAGNGLATGQQAAGNGSDSVRPITDRAESFPSESCTSGSSGSSKAESESESDHPSAPLRGASPLKGASPLRGSRRLKRNIAASKRAVEHIRARSAK